jgi:transposase-like protein
VTDRRPGHCSQCPTKHPLTAHGFYTRTLIDTAFEGVIRVRRYLCQACQRTVSLLPEFVLPYLLDVKLPFARTGRICVRRQLFLWVDDNYFSLPTTITL